jgi:hypothetical protein
VALNLLVSLEALRAAFRGMRLIREIVETDMGNPVTVIREILHGRLGADADRLVDEASFREVEERAALRPIPIGSASPDLFAFADPRYLGSFWVDYGLESTRRAAPSYTAESAMEEIRRVTSGEGTDPVGAAAYRPLEGPTAACSACPALVAPETLWVGKKSGIALCDPCMTMWEKAGRARRSGEF